MMMKDNNKIMENLNKITKFDKECLAEALSVAEEALEMGNYPVGAVLAIGNEIIGVAGNKINEKKSFVNHAENLLIIKYGEILAKERNNQNSIVSLYSTLEPCIQCLGASVTNHIDRIIFIEKDPNGGACDLKHNNIGLWYKEFWPQIIQHKESSAVSDLMVKFFKKTIEKGNIHQIKWAERMLTIFKQNSKINKF